MDNGFRKTLKGFVPEITWPLLRWFDKQLIYCLYIWLWGKRLLVYPRIPVFARSLGLQSISTFPVTAEYNSAKREDFFSQLKSQGYKVFEGRHSIYLGDVDDIERFCPGLSKRYPKGFGLKIVKSLEISKDSTPYYTSCKLAPASTWFSMRAVGSMLEKMTVSNLLHLDGVAPRVYDIVRLTTKQGKCHYAFVVEHIQGSVLTGSPASEFMKSFKIALDANGMQTLSIKEHRDLRPPDYNCNIVSGDSATCYVDIQNFVLADKNIVEQFKGKKNPHPWSLATSIAIVKCVKETNVSFDNKKVLFLGTHSAEFIAAILSSGALWCSVVLENNTMREKYEKAMYLYGRSRFDLLTIGNEDHVLKNPLFACYDLIFFDKGSVEMCEIIPGQLASATCLLLLSEKGDDITAVRQGVLKSEMKRRTKEKIACPGQDDISLSLFH